MSSEDSPSDFPKEIPSGIRAPPNSKITEDYKGNSKDNSICISDKQSEDLSTLLNELKVITNNRFTEMDGKFTEVNGKFDSLNDTVGKGFTNLGNKLDTLIRIFENKK